METYVIGEEENYSDFIREIMSEEQLDDKGEEKFLDKDKVSSKITIEDYWFLAR